MKIQILELPAAHSGEYWSTPYALIASEVPTQSIDHLTEEFAKLTGEGMPEFVYVTEFEVEL